jgi:hypothetical protein
MASLEPPNQSADYRRRAKECREQARHAPDYESARELLQRADIWERLAILPARPAQR